MEDDYYLLLDGEQGADAGASTSLGAGLRSLRPSRGTLRRTGVCVLVAAAAAGSSAAATTWRDSASAHTGRSGIASLALDSVSDGDASAISADITESTDSSAKTTRAEYILEIANNGPAAVTVTGVRFEGRPVLSTSAWHSVGPATIAAGGTGRVAVGVDLDCAGPPGVSPFSGVGGQTLFPDALLTVMTPNGVEHTITLSASRASGDGAENPGDAPPAPQIVEIQRNPCASASTASTDPSTAPSDSPQPPGQGPRSGDNVHTRSVILAYDGIGKPAEAGSAAFGLDFTATDLGTRPVAIDTRLYGAIPITLTDTSGQVVVTPGHPVRFTVTVRLGFCGDTTTDPGAILETPAFVLDDGAGQSEPVPLTSLVNGVGLLLAGDVAGQVEVVCP